MMIVKMSEVQLSMKKIRSKQNSVSRKLSNLTKKYERHDGQLKANKKDTTEMGETTTQLIQVAMKQEEDIEAIASKVERINKTVCKGIFVVKGLKENDGESPIDSAELFIVEKLKIEDGLSVLSAHRMGKTGSFRDLWFKLLNPDDNVEILQNLKNLKEQVNERDEPYSVREQRTEKEREKDQRFKDMTMENRRMPASHQLTIR